MITLCSTNSLSISQKYNEFAIFAAITLWNYCLFREFIIFFALTMSFRENTKNSLFFRYGFHVLVLLIADLVRINLVYYGHITFRDTLSIYYLFRKVTVNLISLSRINFKFILFFENSLSSTRIYYELTVFIANKERIHVMFRKFTMNLLFIPQILYQFWPIHYKNTSCFAKILRILYFFGNLSFINSLN